MSLSHLRDENLFGGVLRAPLGVEGSLQLLILLLAFGWEEAEAAGETVVETVESGTGLAVLGFWPVDFWALARLREMIESNIRVSLVEGLARWSRSSDWGKVAS